MQSPRRPETGEDGERRSNPEPPSGSFGTIHAQYLQSLGGVVGCHHVGASLALGYVPAGLAERTGGFRVEILGEMRDAVILSEPPFDPAGARMRS